MYTIIIYLEKCKKVANIASDVKSRLTIEMAVVHGQTDVGAHEQVNQIRCQPADNEGIGVASRVYESEALTLEKKGIFKHLKTSNSEGC